MAYVGKWAPLGFGVSACIPLLGCVSHSASGVAGVVALATLDPSTWFAIAGLLVACATVAIRERARARRLEGQLQAFEQAINALDVGFAMYDDNERLVLCNQVYADMCYVPAELRTQKPTYEQLVRQIFSARPESLQSLPPGMGLDEWLQMRLEAFRNPKGAHVMWSSGRFIQVYDHKTQSGGIACTRTDVTTIKKAEFAARVQEKRLEMAAAFAGIGVWETDLATEGVKWDARMELMHGYDVGTFPEHSELGKLESTPMIYRRSKARLKKSMAQGGGDFHNVYRIILPDGGVRHIERRGSYLKDQQGNLLRRLGINMDITTQVTQAEALRTALVSAQAATKAKAEFLATMSHEIRTPMNGVIGMTDLLLDTPLTTVQREHAETIRASGDALLTLINDILDFSKIEAGKLELEQVPFSIQRVTADSIGIFGAQARTKGIELIQNFPRNARDLIGDPGRFRQILLNLVSNALKFTHQGHVHVEVDVRSRTALESDVVVRVSDTGIGMTPDYLGRLGEAFLQADTSTTRQFGGTGLGLSICRSLIQLMSGSMNVESTLGQGTCFTVTLPMRSANPVEIERAVSLRAGPPKRLGRVLVAEDNIVNQRVIVALLKRFAEYVDLASDGREAVAKFKSTHYDCVLMDGQMPEMDGLEATHKIREFEAKQGRKRTPIIALTANAMLNDRETFLAGGMDEYLSKPVRADALAAA